MRGTIKEKAMANKYFHILILIFLTGQRSFAMEDQTAQIPTISYNSALAIVWSPEGSKYLVQPTFDQIDIYASSGEAVWSLNKTIGEKSFSPNGNQLLVVVPGEGLYLHSFENNSTRLIFTASNQTQALCQIAWSPSGDKISFWNLSPQMSKFMLLNSSGQVLKDLNFPANTPIQQIDTEQLEKK
jgi:WD40 repeat protein